MRASETFDGEVVGSWIPKSVAARQLRVSTGRLLGHRVAWLRQYQHILGVEGWQGTPRAIAIDVDGIDAIVEALLEVKRQHLAARAARRAEREGGESCE